MAISNVLAVVTVVDFDSTLIWCERLLGRPADRFPMEGLADWHVTESGGIQLFHDPERGGAAQLTLVVDDLRRHIADLAGRDLTVGAITKGDVAIFASITDPEGNTVNFVEPLNTSD